MPQLKVKKRVLITGAAKRLGAHLAVELAKNGYDIVIHYRNSQSDAEKIAQTCVDFGVQAELIKANFDCEKSLKAFLEEYTNRFSQTYALINNVGSFLTKTLTETSHEEWMQLFQTNLNAPFFVSKALESQLKQSQGAIINFGTAGVQRQQAASYAAAYTIAKSSLYLLTKSLAKELAGFHVRVNMISPGHLENSIDLKDPKNLPMQRPAQLEEVSRIVLFLLDEKSSYITGQNIEIAGGYCL